MKIGSAGLVGGMYAILAATMSLPPSFRNIAQATSLLLLVLLALVILTDDRWRVLSRPAVPIVLISAVLTFLICVNAIAFGTGVRSIVMQVFFFFNVLVLAVAARYFDTTEMMRRYAHVSLAIFALLFPLFLVGIDVMKNSNAVGMVTCPYLIYVWHIKPKSDRSWDDFVWLGLIFGASLMLEARLAALIVVLSFLTALLPARNPVLRLAAMIVIGGVIYFNLYFTFNFDFILNELLTNRVLLWNYYGDLLQGQIWTGMGPITREVSAGASERVSFFLSRGANVQYGTQSMYVLYLYQSGVLGLGLVLGLLTFALLRAHFFFWPICLIFAAACSETVSIGAPSIVGTPLTLLVILGGLEKRASFTQKPEVREIPVVHDHP